MAKSYTSLLQQYIAHTNEKEKVIEALTDCLGGKSYKNILDIGCGTGIFVNELIKYADKVTAIDIEKRIDEKIANHPKVNFIKQFFQNFKTDERFDVIVMSFLLWETPYKEWDLIFYKAFNMLNENGVIIVIDGYNKKKCDNSFFSFNTNLPQNTGYPDWYEYLEKNKFIYKGKKFSAHIEADSPEEMYEIMKFFFQNELWRNWYKNNKNKILSDFWKKQKGNKTVIQLGYFINCITRWGRQIEK